MKLASLATIKDKKPWVRFVVSYNHDLILYIFTYASSRKVQQIEKNPNVHVTIGGSLENLKAPYVQIAGCATIRNDVRISVGFIAEYTIYLGFTSRYSIHGYYLIIRAPSPV